MCPLTIPRFSPTSCSIQFTLFVGIHTLVQMLLLIQRRLGDVCCVILQQSSWRNYLVGQVVDSPASLHSLSFEISYDPTLKSIRLGKVPVGHLFRQCGSPFAYMAQRQPNRSST